MCGGNRTEGLKYFLNMRETCSTEIIFTCSEYNAKCFENNNFHEVVG